MPLLVIFGQGDCPLKRRQSHQVLLVLRRGMDTPTPEQQNRYQCLFYHFPFFFPLDYVESQSKVHVNELITK